MVLWMFCSCFGKIHRFRDNELDGQQSRFQFRGKSAEIRHSRHEGLMRDATSKEKLRRFFFKNDQIWNAWNNSRSRAATVVGLI